MRCPVLFVRDPEFRKFLQDGFSRGEKDSSLEYISLRMIGTRVGENIVASGRIQDKVTLCEAVYFSMKL